MWNTLGGLMPKDAVVRARINQELADRIDRWAQEHDASRSQVIREALARFLEHEDERQRRIEEAYQAIDELEETGIFEPPEDDAWKASGGWA